MSDRSTTVGLTASPPKAILARVSSQLHRPRMSFARTVAGLTGAVLLVQFLLGMHVNLYVRTVPVGSHTSGGMMGGGMMNGGFMKAMSRAMSGSSTLMLHMVLGWLLAILAVVALLAALLVRRKEAIGLSALGLVAIVVAGYGGLQFMISGHDGYSYLMATGFIVAMGAYFGEVYALR